MRTLGADVGEVQYRVARELAFDRETPLRRVRSPVAVIGTIKGRRLAIVKTGGDILRWTYLAGGDAGRPGRWPGF